MTKATHIIRFIANEDSRIHLGQLVDTSRDVGLDTFDGKKVEAYLINGSIFAPEVTSVVYSVKQLLSPVSTEDCNYIRCLGLNYKDHANVSSFSLFADNANYQQEANMALPKAPILFTKPRTALADPYPAVIPVPKAAQDGTSDYEAELCVVIGKTGRDIPEDKALDYVLGYTCSNDVSARTMQMLTTQWSFSKGLDGSCPLGPVLVTKDVIPDPQTLDIKAIYNGQTVQDGNTKNMIFDIKKQISYLSQGTTLEAGTIFLTGTPAGIGFFRQPRVVLEDKGDIRVEIEKIGTLINKVHYEQW
ncbi:hypothetical protein LTR99_009572 [Exophiala xenobiotica]|uniref:Fumarylacetoacetase-like C-terminal domain-containing protein n=1 Tax=Vermiconidia calcicola TaxID=1690605 RepID=A0AAV9Q131_9PEZI|nr:hypothetical protein LTR96_001672 [Exophiala xenobiotica]KAK5530327.1 hypothetical protein LTR23_010366 [Chaetothyriales sp. CCFEE 6169]KAK5533267.1 hypothetical protein LTR25_007132 [Vermiconidia calcicola]KAK5294174.1 hypothetical protein LTR99_009572 [Exophiala xenobiotica]KAK5333059.1 hypothetical protein LTR98_010801 [Exophiala xenobiotica]